MVVKLKGSRVLMSKLKGAAYGIKIAKGTGIFANRIEKPKAAIGEEVDRGCFFVK